MNSEISNISKLSPVTVAKAEKAPKQNYAAPASDNVPSSSSKLVLVNKTTTETRLTYVKPEDDKDAETQSSRDIVKKAADEGNALLQSVRRNLQFTVDDSTQELVVKIVDSNSGELVRQIPSEEMLAFIARMQELDGEGHLGNMFQERA